MRVEEEEKFDGQRPVVVPKKVIAFALFVCLAVIAVVVMLEFPLHDATMADGVQTEQQEVNHIKEGIGCFIDIPLDVNESIAELDRCLTCEAKKIIVNGEPWEFHFGLGMMIRNNWKLWGGPKVSPLARYFVDEYGIEHPDYMSGIIIENLHSYLNSKEELCV